MVISGSVISKRTVLVYLLLQSVILLFVLVLTAPPQGVTVPQYTGEIPENEQPKDAPSAPTAPPLEKMDAIPGYQNIGFTDSTYKTALKILE